MKFRVNTCVCGALESTFAFAVADWNFGNTSETADMRRCITCGSLFPDRFPKADALPAAYEAYYTSPRQRTGLRRWRRRLLDVVVGSAAVNRSMPATTRSLLDYGCGSGEFLHAIQNRHPDVVVSGTDVTLPGPRELLPYEWVDLDTIRHHDCQYDWITLSHVVEHLDDPYRAIGDIARVVAPGGGVWIATPNADSFLFRTLRGRARDADFPRHRQIYSRRGLTMLLEAAGFSVTYQSAPRINSLMNLATGLGNLQSSPVEFDAEPKPSRVHAVVQTISRLVSGRSCRDQDEPELIAIARPIERP